MEGRHVGLDFYDLLIEAIVTEGGSGIGHHTCLQFAREGARVLVVDTWAKRLSE